MYSRKDNLLGYHFAKLMAEKSDMPDKHLERFREMVEELIAAIEEGHSCLVLSKEDAAIAGKAAIVSTDKETPLILFNDSLYLHRYFMYEARLARQLKDMAGGESQWANLSVFLDDIFGKAAGYDTEDDTEDDLQRHAASLAATKDLAVISGGPGTGKTTTVVHVIQLLLWLIGNNCSIALAAPTGKAAARLHQSLIETLSNIDPLKEHQKAMLEKASTIHRLLGVKKNSTQFIHNSENPLEFDVVIIDEASMVDLALMSKLVDALKPMSKLILLGDKDQLASVESGAVLADIIETLPQNTVILQKSYRFNDSIKELSQAVNCNNSSLAWSLLEEDRYTDVELITGNPLKQIYDGYEDYMAFVTYCQPQNYVELFRKFNSFRVLCASRLGKFGVDSINLQVEKHFLRKMRSSGKWYPGKPVIITRNDYSLDLYNGDIGICLPGDRNPHEMRIWFEGSEGRFRSYLPYRLPEYQTAYAMTVHKSQGSEFQGVVFILPTEESAVLCRELIYTAITRSREKLWLCGDRNIFDYALSKKTRRASGLAEMLK